MRSLEDLSHVCVPFPRGGDVLVLDTGALLDPETQAMLAARYSRSVKGAKTLIEEMFDRDVGKFMRENYKAGYGHKSIADLGEAAIFIDGISMLCAKAIQDFPLYRGQESSTRYIDFSKQPFMNPAGTSDGEKLLETWRTFYLHGLEVMIPELTERYPRNEGELEKTYQAAIKARAFDIMRAFLPAGATTNVAWVGDLRHIGDHLNFLRNHPLIEVREVAQCIETALLEKFPNSFSDKRYEETEKYLRLMGQEYAYLQADVFPDFRLSRDSLDYEMVRKYDVALQTRPPKTELPFSIRECGTQQYEFTLDFGSFRDLQRHRSVVMPMPLLTPDLGFEQWYLDELPDTLRKEADQIIATQIEAYDELGLSPNISIFELQYYLPMGMLVPIRLTADLRAEVYLIELRSTRFVHATLVRRVRQVAETLTQCLEPTGVQLHMDPEPNRFDVKRGTHDIVKT